MKKRTKLQHSVRIFIALILLNLVSTIAVTPAINTSETPYTLGAHRGASLEFEENTIEAFESALTNSKYSFLEFDIQYTKDKKIVVFHENNMIRMPKKGIEISELTYDELEAIFEFHIPEYHEVMNLINGEKPMQIEIKSQGNIKEDQELVEFVLQDCKERGIQNKVLIASPSEHIIAYVEDNYPEFKTGRVYWVVISTVFKSESLTERFYEESQADYLLLHGYNIRNYDLLKKYKPENKTIIFWYFTDKMYIMGENQEDCIFWQCA